MKTNDQIANWAMDLQSLAQAGLRYGHDVFDRERYEEIRRIAGEMMAARTGIPEEKLKKVWLTFHKVDKSRNDEGTGLGLAICKAILELHNFKYGVENTEKGVLFYFEF